MESTRQNTQSIKELFGKASNTSFFKSECCICLTPVTDGTIGIFKPCDHTSCTKCIEAVLKNGQNCPLCRTSITDITTKMHGTESVAIFLQRFEQPSTLPAPPLTPFVSPALPPQYHAPSRVFTCGGYSGGGGGRGGGWNDEDFTVPLPTLLPCLAVTHTSTLQSTEFNALHSTHNGIGCVTLIGSSDGSESSNIDIFIIIDNSGSMSINRRIENCTQAIIDAINRIKPGQRVSVASFDNTVIHRFGLQQVTPSNKAQLINIVRQIRANGGTDFMPPFELSLRLFEQADSKPARKQMIIFFSDGESNIYKGINAIDTLFASFPTLVLHTISIGNDVKAEKMTELLRNRHSSLGRYHDCPDIETVSKVLTEIIGETNTTFATNVSVKFTDAIPSTSLAHQNDDGTYTVEVPLLNMNEALNIAFLTDGIPLISYSFTKGEEVVSGLSIFDTEGVLPIEISHHYPSSRQCRDRLNGIISNGTISSSEKQTLLRQLLSEMSIENLGNYFQELVQMIETIIQSLEPSNRNNTQIQNRRSSAEQYASREVSSSSTSRILSENIRSASQKSQSEGGVITQPLLQAVEEVITQPLLQVVEEVITLLPIKEEEEEVVTQSSQTVEEKE